MDAEITRNKNEIKCSIHHKDDKLPFQQLSDVPRCYKKNVALGDLYRTNKTSSKFGRDISINKTKYVKKNFPNEFIDSAKNNFYEIK